MKAGVKAGLLLLAGLALASCSTRDVSRVMKGDLPPLGGSLEGGPWAVDDLNGGGVLKGARLEVTFDPGDQDTSMVSGFSGCNRFTGRWWQQGAQVKFGPLAGTKMACAPALMQLEGKFLATLEAVSQVSFGPEGVAVLRSSDGQVIRLRKASGGQPVE